MLGWTFRVFLCSFCLLHLLLHRLLPRTLRLLQCYSSGTTGAAKGVKLSHRNLLSSLLQVHPLDGATDYIPFQTICAGVVPQFHIFGIATVMLRPLLNGCTVVAIPQYSLPTYLSYIQKYKCTFLHVVPPQLLSLAKDPIVTAAHLASVQLLFVAAAPFSPQTVVELQERIGRPVLVKQAWGQTELSPVGTQAPTGTLSLAGKTWIAPAGSCGMVMPNSQIRLVDPDSLEDVELGKEGEIWIKGPQVMLGYLNRPDADKETFVGDWMRTGDIAMFDSEGWLYITDRLKELIKVNAFQVAPSELEALLLTHPAILDCAVIGLPHPRSGQVPKAYVVPKAGQTLRGEEVAKWIEGQVAAYKRLRGGVDVVEAVPKSPSGKILRRVLVDMEKERAAKQEKQAKL